jgi:Domain of unknown function (DUF4129)
MQLEGLTVALRTRTPWEATDLGMALVRAHAGRIWAAWLLITLPVFVLFNALAWFANAPWAAMLALWWLKPVFDRVPLYVISRAVFGPAPGLRETLAAQRNWGWRGIVPWLLWRRLHPGRAMLLPVDLLEGVTGKQRRERVYVLGRAHASPNVMLTLIGVNLEAMLGISIVMFGLMFVPSEFFSDSARAVWQTLFEQPPKWAQVLMNLFVWFGTTVVEPFYIGAGFGLYINRRMQLEAWDIELAFRRMAARLAAPLAAVALLLIAIFVLAPSLHAEPGGNNQRQGKSEDCPTCKDHEDEKITTTLPTLFAESYSEDGAKFAGNVSKAYTDDDLKPTVKGLVWKPRNPEEQTKKAQETPEWAKSVGGIFAFIAEYGLWIALGIVLMIVIANHRRWLSWVSDFTRTLPAPDPIVTQARAEPERLPDDIPAAVRALLQQRRVRAALALLYRAAVQRLVAQLGAPLPPGATESECLRQSRRLRDTHYRELFARIVRSWQGAAYAQRLPSVDEIETLLAEWNAPVETAA